MMNWTDAMMYEERYKDYVREAARERLVREAKAGRLKSLSSLAWVTAWLKQHLVTDTHKPHRTLADSRRA